MKGPARFLNIRKPPDTSNSRTEARTQSPGKAQGPVTAQNLFNGIREDFSPSPVAVARKVLKSGPKAVKVKPKQKEEISPQERLSISFQPTPARFKQHQPDQVVELEAAPAENVLENIPADEGRNDEATKPKAPSPSEVSEVTFKLPVVPISKQTKRREPPQSSEQLESESRYLHSWIPRMKNTKLYIEGEYIDFDTSGDSSTEEGRRYVTSRIISRISANRVTTKKRVYVLEGPLVVKDFEREKKNPTPLFILDKFSNGFPENWQKILNHWAKFDERNKLNISNMSLISSTLLSNYSILGSTLTSLSNVSAINAVNGSHFLPSGLISSSGSSLTISKQANISVRPQPVEDLLEQETLPDQIEQERPAVVTARANEPVENDHDELGEDDVEDVKEKSPEKKSEFTCEDCQFRTQRKSCWSNHIKSKKHLANLVEVPPPGPSKVNKKYI